MSSDQESHDPDQDIASAEWAAGLGAERYLNGVAWFRRKLAGGTLWIEISDLVGVVLAQADVDRHHGTQRIYLGKLTCRQVRNQLEAVGIEL